VENPCAGWCRSAPCPVATSLRRAWRGSLPQADDLATACPGRLRGNAETLDQDNVAEQSRGQDGSRGQTSQHTRADALHGERVQGFGASRSVGGLLAAAWIRSPGASVSVSSESFHSQGHQEADISQHSQDHCGEQHSPRDPERGRRVQHDAREEHAGCEAADD
jgi:hypothetical protein